MNEDSEGRKILSLQTTLYLSNKDYSRTYHTWNYVFIKIIEERYKLYLLQDIIVDSFENCKIILKKE